MSPHRRPPASLGRCSLAPMTRYALDAPTKPLPESPVHARLSRWVGRYEGTAKTYLEPGKPPLEAPWQGEIQPLLGGRFVAFDYRSELFGDPFAGLMLVGFERDKAEFQVTWVDSFHTGTATLLSVGPEGQGAIDVKGRYYVKQTHEYWGWRTEIHDDQEGALTIRMFNATPDGQEMLGVEILLTRKS